MRTKKPSKVKHEGGVVVEGASGLLVRIAKCCNPVPGDDIVGYITKGRGVAIHRVDCMNLRAQENYEQRLLDVEWEDQYSSSNKEYMAHIDIYGLNRTGLLNDVLQVLQTQLRISQQSSPTNQGYEICQYPCVLRHCQPLDTDLGRGQD